MSNTPLNFNQASVRANELVANERLGIGTHTQTATIHAKAAAAEMVLEDGVTNGQATETAFRLLTNSGTTHFQCGTSTSTGSAGDLAFQNYGGANTFMILKSSGRLGINTLSPSSKFHVFSGALTSDTDLANFHCTNGNHSLLNIREIRHDAQSTNWVGWSTRIQKVVDVTNQAYIEFNPEGSTYGLAFGTGNAVEKMRILNGGNVGIGTTNPNSLLTFYRDYTVPSNGSEPAADTVQGITFRSDLNSYGGSPAPSWSNSASPVDVAKIWFQPHSYQGISGSAGVHGYLALGTGYFGSQSSTPDMVINTVGEVGIGITDPKCILHVKNTTSGTSTTDGGVIIQQQIGTSDYVYTGQHKGQLRIQNGLGTYGNRTFEFALSDNGDGMIQANEASVGYHAVCISPAGGNVSIGSTGSGTGKLQVVGTSGAVGSVTYFNAGGSNFYAGNATLGNLSIYAGGGIAAGDYIAASDRRIKDNIVDVEDSGALETLRLLKPKRYTYRDTINKGEEPVWGFIAQEVRETLPYATTLIKETVPNIYELANVSSSNVITFTNFNTSNLEANANTIRVMTRGDKTENVIVAEVIDDHTIRVEEDLSEWTGSVDETGNVVAGNQLFIYGQQVNDFVFLKKDAIWTVATAAIQEVDRQLQDTKAQLASVLARLDALENPS